MSDKVDDRDFQVLQSTVEELQKARNAAINLIEDLNREIEKRKQYEEELKAGEEKFRSLFHDHAAVKLILDPDNGNIVDANEAAAHFYGWRIDELKQMKISQINTLPPEILKKEMEKARGLKNIHFEFQHRKADGNIVDVEVFSSKVHIGGKDYLHSIIHDISERKKADEALRESEQKYRELIDGMNETVWVIGFDGKLIDVNNKALEILGYTKEELLTIGIYGIDSALHVDEIKALLGFMPEDKIEIFETTHKTKDGRIFPVEVYSSIVNYQGEKAFLSIARDITERKRNEKIQQILYDIARTAASAKSIETLLEEVRTKLSNVLDTANFYVALHNPEKGTLKKVILVNEKFNIEEWEVKNSLSGYVILSATTLLVTGEERKKFAQNHQLTLSGIPPECWLGVPLMEDEKAFGVLVVQSYTNASAYDANSARLLEMVAHELSIVFQRKKMIGDLIHAKEKAEESDRLKLAFLANISHEIRTPMNGILGFLDLLKRPNLNDGQKEKFIAVVNQSGQRLLATINDIVEISKIESGLIELQNTKTSIEEIMDYHYEFFKHQALATHLTFKRKDTVFGQKALVIADKYKLNGILTNLLSNALKFTHQGGIEFGNYIKDKELVFYVKDTGIGIPPERAISIFDRFVQAEQGLTRQYEGSGLGLSIAKAYIEIMKGKIWVESEITKGSIFYFTIPYNPVNNQPEAEVAETLTLKNRKGKITLLLAEDDETSYKYLDYVLQNEGFNILHTVNGKDTVKAVKENPSISLVLMDIKMPGMNGLDATREIREFNREIPIIAQTAHALSGDKDKAIEAGCNDYISKPINADELMKLIARHSS
ncbi:MAG: PAS domain S-box protein [Bacteroidales bacterium]